MLTARRQVSKCCSPSRSACGPPSGASTPAPTASASTAVETCPTSGWRPGPRLSVASTASRRSKRAASRCGRAGLATYGAGDQLGADRLALTPLAQGQFRRDERVELARVDAQRPDHGRLRENGARPDPFDVEARLVEHAVPL